MRHLSVCRIVVFAAIFLTCLGPLGNSAMASAPGIMNYQGRLTNSGGQPVTDGNYSIKFTLYDAAAAGTALWAETLQVATSSGLFSVQLGSVHPLTAGLFSSSDRWLGLSVGSDPELTPRTKFATVAYAFAIDPAASGFLPLSGGVMTGPITSTGDPSITMGKGNFGSSNQNPGIVAFVAGANNQANGDASVVAGGLFNSAAGSYSSVGGGNDNVARGAYSGVFSGTNNSAGNTSSDNYAFVGGGLDNLAGSTYAALAGGYFNFARGVYSFIGGGANNKTFDSAGTIGGGAYNYIMARYGTVGGGQYDSANAAWATVSGGYSNTASGAYSAALSGWDNASRDSASIVAGGSNNVANAKYSTVAGGQNDTANWSWATVVGGYANRASGEKSFVGGGGYNAASGWGSTIGGGYTNYASDDEGVVGGGLYDSATGQWAVVPGGNHNVAAGQASLAAGKDARAANNGSFVWADVSGGTFSSNRDNQVKMRANGGVWFSLNSGRWVEFFDDGVDRLINVSNNAYLSRGGQWVNNSDRNMKEKFTPVEGADLLSKIDRLPITRWKYKTESDEVSHIGPMAQDFHAIFGVGGDSTAISTLDPSGIALAAIQELSRQNNELKRHNAALESRLDELQRKIETLLSRQ